MKVLRETSALEKNVFSYLNELRESGKVNMFGAIPYITDSFVFIKKNDAKDLLKIWMDNFNKEGDYKTIVDAYVSDDYRGSSLIKKL